MSGVLLLTCAGSVVVGGWKLVRGGESLSISGDFTAVAAEAEATVPAVHPLITGRPVVSHRSADGRALGRHGTTMLADARNLLNDDRGPVAVPALQLSDDAMSWVSPRRLRIIDGRGAVRARADLCASGIESQVRVAGQLVLAGCGRTIGVADTGQVQWQRRADPKARLDLLPLGDHVVVSEVGARAVTMLDADDGRVVWRTVVSGDLRRVRAVGTAGVVVVSADRTGTRITSLDAATGELQWKRRWDAWSETATAATRRRIILGLTDVVGAEGCERSGLVELDATTGATLTTRANDRRMYARDIQVDAGTSRPVVLMQARSCSIAMIEPRLDVTTAGGLEVLHRVPIDARPCSGISTTARLAAFATCSEVVAVDTLNGSIRWRQPLQHVTTRDSVAVNVTSHGVAVTDDVGSLTLLSAPPTP